jgi:hypothetical protein
MKEDVGQSVDVPAHIFPHVDDAHFVSLRFIDPYGDTLFNRLQVPVVLEELDQRFPS